MLFCTLQYVLFLSLILAVYWTLPEGRWRVWLLLVASFDFYRRWNEWLAVVIAATTILDWLLALAMQRCHSSRWRRFILVFSLCVNLGLLIAFKYANFLIDSLRDALQHAGAEASLPVLAVILPIGISFYTFEAINYMVDVYRRKIPAERDLGHFMLFILFFPHLVAGPIVRAKDFLPQIKRPKRWHWPRVGLGLWLIVLGTFKKLAIADRMAPFADPIFAEPGVYSALAIAQGAIAFALQVYCDFSGYSDIALGSAYLLGYKLAINFRLPFLAVNMADFWRRWHISLSTWLRDYLFIPLGGSRGSRWRVCRNLLIVMTIGGLWHGATWNCVLWGFAIGVLLVVHKLFADACRGRERVNALLQSPLGTAGRVLFTFASFVMTLIIFRTVSLSDTGVMFARLFSGSAGAAMPMPVAGLYATIATVFFAHLLGAWLVKHPLAVCRFMVRIPPPAIGVATASVLQAALLLGPAVSKSFIYFQF